VPPAHLILADALIKPNGLRLLLNPKVAMATAPLPLHDPARPLGLTRPHLSQDTAAYRITDEATAAVLARDQRGTLRRDDDCRPGLLRRIHKYYSQRLSS